MFFSAAYTNKTAEVRYVRRQPRQFRNGQHSQPGKDTL